LEKHINRVCLLYPFLKQLLLLLVVVVVVVVVFIPDLADYSNASLCRESLTGGSKSIGRSITRL
jgi:hypothetical protein